MRFDIRYRCSFEYDAPVRDSQNELRVCPASDHQQSVLSYRVLISPTARVYSFDDYWGTRVDAVGGREAHTRLDVVAEASVETRPPRLVTSSPRLDRLQEPQFIDEHSEYLQPTRHTAWGDAVVREAEQQASLVGRDVVSVVLALHRRAATHVDYVPGATYVGVSVDEVLDGRAGVCQDFAHLVIALCRSIGIPARYVSGYLFTLSDATGEDTVGDVVEVQTHAWIEAAVPGFGWLALDPTNQQEVGLRHVKIGHGRDYDDVAPLRGSYSGGRSVGSHVSVEIRRLAGLQAQQAQQQQQQQ